MFKILSLYLCIINLILALKSHNTPMPIRSFEDAKKLDQINERMPPAKSSASSTPTNQSPAVSPSNRSPCMNNSYKSGS